MRHCSHPKAIWPQRWVNPMGFKKWKDGVTNGTRTRNIQNHNLGLYH
jgi:hypothetical protein